MPKLVTGAAGFIASQVVTQLLDAGEEVVGVDNINDAYDQRLKYHRLEQLEGRDGFTFHKLDLENIADLRKVFAANEFDAVLNLAARAGVRYSMVNPFVYLSTNGMGTLNILELMREFGVKKQVLASTSSLYAGQPMPFVETAAVNTPLSPYAASKKAAEVMSYSYNHLHGLDTTVVRFFTVYGPAGRPDMSIFRFMRWIDTGEPIIMYGDGEQSRDFTYVGDIARGAILAAKPLGYEIINLGGGQNPISMNKVIAMLEERLGKKAVVDYQEEHIADVRETWANIDKAKELIDWEPQISLEDGLDLSVEWYRQNQEMACSLDLQV
ncbi:MAG: UDP-glucuronate 4-epimerase [Verrucomicrobiales bacterium]|jgi:UDP-glucuronate 4-epimerase